MPIKLITIWKRFNNETSHYEHNHIEDGQNTNPFPTPCKDIGGKPFPAQTNWKNGKWQKVYATLVDNKVVYET
jgi:hypothetical protein